MPFGVLLVLFGAALMPFGPPLVPGWGLLLVKMELSQFEVWAWSRHRHETDHDRETLNY